MIGQLIAEQTGGGIDILMKILPWVTAFVVAVLGAVFAGLAKVKGKAEGKAEALQVGPQPFMVELKEQFITRREFDQLSAMVAVNATEMKGLFRETMSAMADQSRSLTKRIENQNDRLTQVIQDVAKGAYESRQKIHVKVNEQGEAIAALEAKVDISKDIADAAETLAEALTKKPATR